MLDGFKLFKKIVMGRLVVIFIQCSYNNKLKAKMKPALALWSEEEGKDKADL